jgi:3-oxoacyl-[acyl-carrier protein] reductase
MNTTTQHGEGRVAIVTGASRGIGGAIAVRLAADGMAVIVNYAGRAADAEAVVSQIKAQGGRAAAVQADISDPAKAAALFDAARDVFGGVDVLVNNAGIMQPGQVPLANTDDNLFDRLVAINLKGTFNTLRLAAERLRPGGRIVNLSSSVVGLALTGYSVYAATKAAVEAMTRIFANELRGRNITVNAIAPGPTGTDLFLKDKSEAQVEHLAKMPPLERLGMPEDAARVVSFLAGPDGAWVNGQVVRVNGGIV